MRAARNRRWLAAGLLALSMFSCSYGDREDKKEDEKAKRGASIRPAPAVAVAVLLDRERPGTISLVER